MQLTQTLQKNNMPTMTRRYFYTDPLAAWMVRHHGLKIHGPARMPTGGIGTSTRPMPMWILARAIEHPEKGVGPQDAKYFISPDSLHMLDPHIGDTCQVIEDGWTVIRHIHDVYDRETFKASWQLKRIIERNGKPFHWPESEVV